jgi:DNA-binding response OmpR family regulator
MTKGGISMTAPFILLVDDEVPFVEAMAKRLNKRNIQTITALSAEEGLETLKKHANLDVVVLDIKMPGMDGIAALKEIKRQSPLTEVIILSGQATVERAIAGMKLGAFDFLKKPCDLEELITGVEAATQKKQAHEQKIKAWKRFVKTSTLKELMVPLAEYATISEEANILEAVIALEKSQRKFDPQRYRHRSVIVLNKEKRVVGKLSQHDIIQALEPKYKNSKEHQKVDLDHFGFSWDSIEAVSLEYNKWDGPLQNLYKKATDQKVKAFMHQPTEGEYIHVSASVDETIHQLIVGQHHSLLVTDGPEILGIVRLTDVFEFINLRLKTIQHAVNTNGESLRTAND